MIRFVWPWKEIGLDTQPWRFENTIPIRYLEPNLLVLRDYVSADDPARFGPPTTYSPRSSKTHPVRYDTGLLSVEEVENYASMAYLEWYLDSLDVSGSARKDLMDKMWPIIQYELQSLHIKMFRVKGKVLGPTKLEYGKTTQQVEVITSASYTVSFRFLKPYSGAGTRPDGPVAGTTHSPAEIDDWIANLNWIFGSQANVTFEKGTSDWFTSETWLGPLTKKSFIELGFESKQDGAADVTVCLVGVVGDVVALTYKTKTDSWITLVPDRPSQTYYTSDTFIGVLAHELSHFVEKDEANTHFCGTGFLRAWTPPESTLIGDVLRPLLVKPGSPHQKGTVCG
jgi:hypothetical protein